MTDHWPREAKVHSHTTVTEEQVLAAPRGLLRRTAHGLLGVLSPPKGYDPYWWHPLDVPIVEVEGRESEGLYVLTVSQRYLNRQDPPWPRFEVLPRWLCRLLGR